MEIYAIYSGGYKVGGYNCKQLYADITSARRITTKLSKETAEFRYNYNRPNIRWTELTKKEQKELIKIVQDEGKYEIRKFSDSGETIRLYD